MKAINKTFVGVILLALMCLITTSIMTVSASSIVIVKDTNPSGVVGLSLGDENYSIAIDDETGYGYVVSTLNNNEEILGSCSVIVIDRENPNGYTLCSEDSSMTSYGTMVIVVTNEVNSEGVIHSISGQFNELFDINDKVVIEE